MTNTTAATPSLTRVLVRLKVRLIANRAASTKGGRFSLVMSLLVGGGLGALGLVGGLAAGAAASDDARRAVLVIAPNLLVVGWALLPLASFGSDETLDPGRLVLYPLRRAPLMRGLLAASFVGAAPLAATAATAGVALGFGGLAGLLVAVPAGGLALLMAVALSRALTTSLAAALSSRRSRDAAVVVGSLLAVGVQGLRFVRLPSVSDPLVDQVVDVARWTPPGLLGQAVVEGRSGHWFLALADLLPALVVMPALVWLWGRSLERSLTVVVSGSTSTRSGRRSSGRRGPGHRGPGQRRAGRRRSNRLALLPAWLPFITPTPWGAAAARDLRYSWRDPRRKSAVLIRTLLAIGGPVWLLVQSSDPSPRLVLLASLVGYLAVLGTFNQFGFDGGALWSDLAAGDRVRALLVGKNVSALVQVMPAVAVAAVILAAATGGWLYVPVALLLAVGGVGVGLGVADVVSVRMPFKMLDTRNPFGAGAFGAGGGGQGFTAGLALFGASLLQNLLMAPVAIGTAVALWLGPGWLVAAAPLAVAYGYAIWRVALQMAVQHAWWREPELLAAVDPARSN